MRAQLEELDSWRTELDYRGPIPRAWAGRLRRDLEAEAVAASTSMEGVPVTLEEVHRILAGDRPSETREEDAALVRGYRDAMSFVLRRADDVTFKWDRELLIGLHDRALAGNWGAGAGRFRTGPAYVVDVAAGTSFSAPARGGGARPRRRRLCGHAGGRRIRRLRRLDPRGPGAIHPFRDGNGRAARVVASLAMYRGGFRLRSSPRSRNGGDGICPTTTRHSGASAVRSMRLSTSRRSSEPTSRLNSTRCGPSTSGSASSGRSGWPWRRRWPATHLPARVANAAWDVFFGRSVTPRYYRPLADVSPATATNDLAAAVAAGCCGRRVGPDRGRIAPERDSISASGPCSECLSMRPGTRRGRPSSAS